MRLKRNHKEQGSLPRATRYEYIARQNYNSERYTIVYIWKVALLKVKFRRNVKGITEAYQALSGG